jgi:alkylhydroperoxidase family enzyme
LIADARVDDALRAALLAEFDDTEIVVLTATIATAIAFSKASVAFGAPDDMPRMVVPTPAIDGDVVW